MTHEELIVKKLNEWFLNHGFKIRTNTRVAKNHVEIDLLGTKNGLLYGVEVKAGVHKNIMEKALIQTIRFKPYVNFAFIGIPFVPKKYFEHMCKSVGIGIFLIDDDVSIFLDGKKEDSLLNLELDSLDNDKKDHSLVSESHEILLIPLLIIIKKFENQPLSSVYVGSLLKCSQQSASRKINIAIKEGYVVKRLSNQRAFIYELTEKGRSWLENLSKEILRDTVTLKIF